MSAAACPAGTSVALIDPRGNPTACIDGGGQTYSPLPVLATCPSSGVGLADVLLIVVLLILLGAVAFTLWGKS